MTMVELMRELLEEGGFEVATFNEGLVIKTEDGSEYQVTIVKSK